MTVNGNQFYEWDYTVMKVRQWLRMGTCNQCGECCHGEIHIRTTGEDHDARNGSDGTDGNDVWHEMCPIEEPRRLVKITGIDRAAIPEREEPCYDEVLGCQYYNDDRPFICQAWPMSPRHVEPFDNCSYSFILLSVWKLDEQPGGEDGVILAEEE